jgi:hypothetical protein
VQHVSRNCIRKGRPTPTSTGESGPSAGARRARGGGSRTCTLAYANSLVRCNRGNKQQLRRTRFPKSANLPRGTSTRNGTSPLPCPPLARLASNFVLNRAEYGQSGLSGSPARSWPFSSASGPFGILATFANDRLGGVHRCENEPRNTFATRTTATVSESQSPGAVTQRPKGIPNGRPWGKGAMREIGAARRHPALPREHGIGRRDSGGDQTFRDHWNTGSQRYGKGKMALKTLGNPQTTVRDWGCEFSRARQ